MVCSEKLRRWSSSSIIFRRWVTGTPPCDPNLSQPPGNHRSITSREASAAQRLRANGVIAEVHFGAGARGLPDFSNRERTATSSLEYGHVVVHFRFLSKMFIHPSDYENDAEDRQQRP